MPAIQCIADFSFVPEWILSLHPTLQTRRGWWYGDSILRRTYLGLCNLISRSDPKGFKKDLMVANSAWSRELMREKFGVEFRALIPPSLRIFPPCLGRSGMRFRLHRPGGAGKRPDGMIRHTRKVRQRGHDIHFHILGGGR